MELEISIFNADKDAIPTGEIFDRLSQDFSPFGLLLNRAATFAEKAQLYPNCTFLVGADTVQRIDNERFYLGNRDRRNQAIQTIKNQGCDFLVFGRKVNNIWLDKHNLNLGSDLESICRFIAESEFREDISSTNLRRQNQSDV